MKNNTATPGSKVKPVDKTDWQRVINQTDCEIERNAKTDLDSPVLENKKYYKPEKNDQK